MRPLLAAALLLVTVGCSGHATKHARVARSSNAPVQASGRPTGTSPGTKVGVTPPPAPTALHAKVVVSAVVSGFEINHLCLFGHWVGFSSGPAAQHGSVINTVQVLDLNTRRVSVVARSTFTNGLSDWIEGTGDWIFWTDQPQVLNDASPPGPWAIYGQNLVSGRRITIAKSRFDSTDPIPRAGNGHLVWFEQQAPGKPQVSIKAFDTATSTVSTLTESFQTPSSITPGKNLAAFDVLTAKAKSDVWTVPWTGGTPTQYTNTGLAREARIAEGSDEAVWEEAALNDAARFDTADLDHRQAPHPLGPAGATSAVPGLTSGSSAFIAYITNGTPVQVLSLAGNTAPLTIPGGPVDVACRLAVLGNEIAFCRPPDITTYDRHTIYVERID